MNLLLTGHGNLGLPLAQRLSAMGHGVRVLSRSPRTDVPWQVIVGRLDDGDAVLAAAEGCEVIVHNGARLGQGHDIAEHGKFVAGNIVGSANVFSAAVRLGVRHVVHVSSDVVLGWSAPPEETESAGRARLVRDSDPLLAQSIYGATKLAAEELARYYRREHGLSVTILRPGWFPPPGHLADHEFVYRLLGHCPWVGDVVAAVLAAIERPAQGEFLIHAATPFAESDAAALLRDPASVLRRYWPEEARWWLDERKLPAPPVRWWADIRPAVEQLGYAPTLDFAAAVARMRAGKSPWPTVGLQLAR
jgi:nucleoside-diphosphate-sugar epimerase